MRKTLLLALLIAPLLATPALAQRMYYQDARPLALENEKASPAEYMQQLTTFYSDLAKQTLPACAKQENSTDDSLISVVSSIDAEGRILHVWRMGNSKLSPCFVAALKSATFPKPPFQPYYTVVDMHGDPTKY